MRRFNAEIKLLMLPLLLHRKNKFHNILVKGELHEGEKLSFHPDSATTNGKTNVVLESPLFNLYCTEQTKCPIKLSYIDQEFPISTLGKKTYLITPNLIVELRYRETFVFISPKNLQIKSNYFHFQHSTTHPPEDADLPTRVSQYLLSLIPCRYVK